MSRPKLLQEVFDARVESVRSRKFDYRPKRPPSICWPSYNAAQENEFPEVIGLIGGLVERASESFRLAPRFDAVGREPYSKRDIARLVLAQQYEGRCNRVFGEDPRSLDTPGKRIIRKEGSS